MATMVKIARVDSTIPRINKTEIATVAAGGTVVDFADPAVRRDLNVHSGSWVVMAAEADNQSPSSTYSTVAVATEAGNAIAVTVTLKDAYGIAVAGVRPLRCWLSSDSTTGVVASDDMAVTATTGALLVEHTDDLVFEAITDANGVLVLSVADAGNAAAKYLWIDFPGQPPLVSAVIDLA